MKKQKIALKKYPLSSEQITSQELIGLGKIKESNILVKENSIHLLKNISLSLLKDFKIYLIFIESFPQPKSKIRTFKKMFYHKKNKLGIKNLYEVELELENNQSILSGIIRLDKKNFEVAISQINSNFSFGFVVQKGKRSFPTNREKFLLQIKQKKLIGRKAFKINILRLLPNILNKNRMVYTLKSAGNDKEEFSFFMNNKNSFDSKLEKILTPHA